MSDGISWFRPAGRILLHGFCDADGSFENFVPSGEETFGGGFRPVVDAYPAALRLAAVGVIDS